MCGFLLTIPRKGSDAKSAVNQMGQQPRRPHPQDRGRRTQSTVAEELNLKAGDSVLVEAVEGHITLCHAAPTLEELVAGIAPENCHGETNWGRDVGKEIVEW
jgi:antitoxin component of MazEF toxin-antitoxin module